MKRKDMGSNVLGSPVLKSGVCIQECPQSEFIGQIELLRGFCSEHGLVIRFASEAKQSELLGRMDPLAIRRAAAYVKGYLGVLQSAVDSRIDLEDNRRLVWSALKFFKLHGGPNLIGDITENEIVEIYDDKGIQLFRNLHFFDYSSYCFEDLISAPWNELYYRESQITDIILRQMGELFSYKDTSGVFYDIPDHQLTELCSEERRRILCSLRLRAPLYFARESHPVAALTSLQATPLNFKLLQKTG